MGDGSVALILDVVSIVKQASKLSVNIASHTIDQKEFAKNALVIARSDKLESLSFIKEHFSDYNVYYHDSMNIVYTHPSSLIFLDLSLPNVIDTINDIRELPATKKSYIVGLSEDLASDKVRFEDTGLNAIFSVKQINFDSVKGLLKRKMLKQEGGLR